MFEIHGNVVEWQCGYNCGAPTWSLPPQHRFHIGSDMRAPRLVPPKETPVPVGCSDDDDGDGEAKPHDEWENEVKVAGATAAAGGGGGGVAAGGGARAVRALGKTLSCYGSSGGGGGCRAGRAAGGGSENHIVCRGCGRRARPNVLMFDDDDWDEPEEPEREYIKWEKAAMLPGRVVILEGGCGKRVPTVRQHSNSLVKKGASLIRINSLESDVITPKAAFGVRTVPLQCGVLHALKGIDAFISRARGKGVGDGGTSAASKAPEP